MTHNLPQHERDVGQYLQHSRKGPNLRQIVEKCSERPEATLMTLNELLKSSPDRVVGFVALGGLVHFNSFLKKGILSDQVLNLLLHSNFPFVFEEIESSGLGQTVYDISEKKGQFQKLAKRIFDIWREQNGKGKKKKGVRHQKVRFYTDNTLAIAVPFEANQNIDTFSLAVAKQVRNHFRPSIPWQTPQVLSEAAIVKLKINKNCISESRDKEKQRQLTVLEETGNRMTTPEENYTPGRTGEELKIVPNDTIESQSSVVIPSGDVQKLQQQLSEGENDFVDRLFSTMESAGFPNPNSRKRRRADNPSEGSRSLPKRRFHDGPPQSFSRDSRDSRRNQQSFRRVRPSHSQKRRVCRYFNTDRGCVFGQRCYDLHQRPPGMTEKQHRNSFRK